MPACWFGRRSAPPQPWWIVLLLAVPLYPQQHAAQSADHQTSLTVKPNLPTHEVLTYGVEWRLIRAGLARLTWNASRTGYQVDLHLESQGMVSKLYKIDDNYTAQMDDQICGLTTYMKALEGKRQRETMVTFDRSRNKATYLERDLVKNTIVGTKEISIPPCVYELMGGLYKLRLSKLEPGQSTQVPISDGKKSVMLKVDAEERENVKTPTGNYKTIRYEVHMMNDVLMSRKGRVFVWLTDDERKLPVQIRIKLNVMIGTITLALEKEERN